MGDQDAHTGSAYAGLIVYADDNSFNDYKEYLEVELLNPLIAGFEYKVSFYCTLADFVSSYASKDIGIVLSPGNLGYSLQLGTITQVPSPIQNSDFIHSSSEWVLVEGTYFASGNETHLTIGSFVESNEMEILFVNPSGEGFAYYFVDDVSVTINLESDIFGENYGNGYNPNEASDNAFYEEGCWYDVIVPNVFTPQNDGVNEEFFIKYAGFIKAEIVILDRWGNTVYQSTDFLTESWNGAHQSDGVYFYTLQLMKQDGQFIQKTGNIQVIGLE